MSIFNCTCGCRIPIVPPSEHAGYLVLNADDDLHIDYRTETIHSFLYIGRAF